MAQGTQNGQETTPRVQNIHIRVAYEVIAQFGAAWRAILPQGIDFGGPTGHQKKGVDSPESKTQIRPLEGSRVRRTAPKCTNMF